jgi:hypothetical protein
VPTFHFVQSIKFNVHSDRGGVPDLSVSGDNFDLVVDPHDPTTTRVNSTLGPHGPTTQKVLAQRPADSGRPILLKIPVDSDGILS